MDIDKQKDNVSKLSNFFDEVNKFIRKHPIWFILLILAGVVYWGSTLEGEDISEDPIEEVNYDESWDEPVEDTAYYDEQVVD